ncbi:MAG: Vgb family protein, partial [Gemmatimonadaceae bacterium]
RLDPRTGDFKRFELEPNTGPHNLIVDRDGFVWYAGNRNAHVGRLDPKDGSITKFPMPDPAARDPHTLIFDRNGDIWFTAQQSNFVGRLTVKTGKVDLVKVPTENSRPYGIMLDSRGRAWFNEFNTNKIAMVDPATLAVKEYATPHERTRGRRIAVTSDDKVWQVDYSRGFVGRLDPGTGTYDEWPSPSGTAALPYGMTVDDRDRIWYVESGVRPNKLVGFDTKTRTFLPSTTIPSGGGTVRYIYFHKPTNSLWFGTDANTIGRATLP